MSDIINVTFSALELRVPDTSERIVEGIVVPWGETSFLTPDPRGERFRPGSLTRTLKERGDRVKLYRNHDHGTAVGKAVQWKSTEAGQWGQFRIANTPAGDAVLNEIHEGMLDAFSVGFLPKRETRGAADACGELVAVGTSQPLADLTNIGGCNAQPTPPVTPEPLAIARRLARGSRNQARPALNPTVQPWRFYLCSPTCSDSSTSG